MSPGTARFANAVAIAGRPRAVTLWTKPGEDRDFMKAVKAHRVMTVKRDNVGQRKDHAEIGFLQEPLSLYLEFPRSLRQFAGKRIIGIKYDLLAETETARPAKRSTRRASP